MKHKPLNAAVPIEILKKIFSQTLDATLLPLEERVNQKMIDLKYLQDSSQQMIKTLSVYSSSLNQQRKLRPKVKVIKKSTKSPSHKVSTSPPSSLNQASKILNTKGRLTIKPPKPSISHDKINHMPKKKSPVNFPDYSLTRAPTMKSFTPVSTRMDKSTSNVNIKRKVPSHKKVYNTKVITSTSDTSTPSVTPKRSIKADETKVMNYNKNISNYFGKPNNNNSDLDDMFLMQDKFNLTDIRFSKIPFLSNNNSTSNNEPTDFGQSLINGNNSNALALGDQLETNWDVIGKYISTQEMLKLTSINKQFGTNTMNLTIARIETEIEHLDEEISQVKLENLIDSSPFESNPNDIEHSNNKSIPYEFNLTTQRAINLLNEPNMDKIFINTSKTSTIPCDDILTIYWLYFTIIQHRVFPFHSQTSKELLWKETCDYFSNRTVPKLGLFIENEVKKAKISNESVYQLDLFARNNSGNRKLSPTYYQNICPVTGIIVFVIKDVMDHLGIGKDNSSDKRLHLRILNARLEMKNKILMKLNNINSKYLN